MRGDGFVGRGRRPELVLVRGGQLRDLVEAARRSGRVDACSTELAAVERRALEQVAQLRAVTRVVERTLLVPGQRFGAGHSGPRSYSTAPSAFAAIRNPTGCSCSSTRCASRPAVRARIGTAFTALGAKPRSSRTAAIGIETFIGSGFCQTLATASRRQRAIRTCGPLPPRASAGPRTRSPPGPRGRGRGGPDPGTPPPA